MDTHKNARLAPKGREEMVRAVVDRGLSKAAAARQFNTTIKTVGKWVGRFLAEGVEGLRDRSSRPLSSPVQIPLATCDAVESLRRQRCTQEQIAAQLRISKASVSRILKRRGLSLLSALEPQTPRPRYERASPGEIIHIDIKKLGRFNRTGHRITRDVVGHSGTGRPGWEFVHVAIDDHSRVATARVFPDEKKESAVAFLEAAVSYYRSLGIIVSRVMTDNGSCYRSKAFVRACKRLDIKPIRTRPTRRRPMEKPSASSRPRCESGPTQKPTTTPMSDTAILPYGCIATTGTDPMLASANRHQSADSA